jgi:hypothetical protein
MFYASLASAAAFFVVPAVGSYIVTQTPSLNPDGTPDNVPVRAVGVLLFMSPFLFVVVAGLTFAGAVLLQRIGQLKPAVLTGIVAVVSVGLAFVMVLDRPFGWRDALYYFVGFAALILSTLSLSALVWWKVAMRPNNTVERDGEPHPIKWTPRPND